MTRYRAASSVQRKKEERKKKKKKEAEERNKEVSQFNYIPSYVLLGSEYYSNWRKIFQNLEQDSRRGNNKLSGEWKWNSLTLENNPPFYPSNSLIFLWNNFKTRKIWAVCISKLLAMFWEASRNMQLKQQNTCSVLHFFFTTRRRRPINVTLLYFNDFFFFSVSWYSQLIITHNVIYLDKTSTANLEVSGNMQYR